MSRLLLFLLGLSLGAVGTFLLFVSGTLHVGAPPQVAAAPAASAPTQVPPPAASAVELPALPSAPSPGGVAPLPSAAPDAMPPLAPGPELSGNAGVDPVDGTATGSPEAIAAQTAAQLISGAGLLMPVQGVQPKQLVDTYTQSRGEGRVHDAIDIMAARGTPVLAVADGRVAKLFTSQRGGLTVYQFDREEKLAYYYAHLDRYAPSLVEGAQLRRGDPVGFVGSTGNASPDAPHLHFAVFVLGPEKRWWQGTAVNPYPLLGGR